MNLKEFDKLFRESGAFSSYHINNKDDDKIEICLTIDYKKTQTSLFMKSINTIYEYFNKVSNSTDTYIELNYEELIYRISIDNKDLS